MKKQAMYVFQGFVSKLFLTKLLCIVFFRSRNPTCIWTLWKPTADVEKETWTTGRTARNIAPSLTVAGILWKLISKNLAGIGSSFQKHTPHITVQVQSFDFRFNYSKFVFNEFTYSLSGDCPLPVRDPSLHTHVTQDKYKGMCCAPKSTSSISMLYYDERMNIVYGRIPGMTVNNCSCF